MLTENFCFHLMHKTCFKNVCGLAKSKGQQIKCSKPDCQIVVPDFEVKSILNEEEMKDLEEAEQNYLIS